MSEQPERIAYWKNKPASELTREEAIAAYQWALKALHAERKMVMADAELERAFTELERMHRRA